MRQRGRALTTALAVPRDLDEFLWLFVRVTLITGNGYYIPKATEQGLNVKVSLQTSRNHRGKKDTSARYATAWLDHGANATAKGYEYAILVGTQLSELQVQNTFNVKYIYQLSSIVLINVFPRWKTTMSFFDQLIGKESTVGLLFCFCRHLLHNKQCMKWSTRTIMLTQLSLIISRDRTRISGDMHSSTNLLALPVL